MLAQRRATSIDIGSIALFLTLAIVLSVLWAQYASHHGLMQNPQSSNFVALLAQLSVLIAALITMLMRSRASFKRIGWHFGPLRAYATVLVITIAVVGAVTVAGYVLGGLIYTPQLHGAALAVTLPMLLAVACLFAFFEEFGWRGFLLPLLLPLGLKRALWVSGICWFLWELPLVVYGILDATLIHLNLPVTLGLHLVQTLSVAIAFGYLRCKFDSIVLPTFAHGLLNALGGVSFLFLSETEPFIGDFAGYIGTTVLTVVAAVILVKARLSAADPGQPA